VHHLSVINIQQFLELNHHVTTLSQNIAKNEF